MSTYYSGRVHSVVFENSSQGFYVIRMIMDNADEAAEHPVVRGHVSGIPVGVGTWFGFEGDWVNHPSYGRQIAISRAPVIRQWTPEVAVSILTANGVGERLADALLAHFDDQLVVELDKHDASLIEVVPGMTPLSAAHIVSRWKVAKAYYRTLSFLTDVGVPRSKVSRVWSMFGDGAEEVLSRNPWALVRIEGITFQQTDEVAVRLGLDLRSPARVEGAVRFVCRTRKGLGHLYLTSQEVHSETASLVEGLTAEVLAQAIADLHRQKHLVVDRKTRVGTTAIYDPWLHHVEVQSATEVVSRLRTARIDTTSDRHEAYLRALSATNSSAQEVTDAGGDVRSVAEASLRGWSLGSKVTLSAAQLDGALNALIEPVSVLTGLPGTGKTTTLKAVVSILKDAGVSFLLVAPTGIAAKRITSVCGAPASTIHRAFGAKGWDRGEEREATYVGITGTTAFGVDGSDGSAENWACSERPHAADVVICDECFYWKQPILTEHGWEPIGKIVEARANVRVWARDPVTGELRLRRVTGWLKKPNPRDLVRIDVGRLDSQRSARVIRCTPDHKILTPSGYVRAGALSVGDPVVVCGTSLSTFQRQVLIGSVLGDGSLARRDGSPQMTFSQGEAQASYLEFKRSVFGSLASPITMCRSGYPGGRPVHRFRVSTFDDLRDVADEMVPDGVWPNGHARWSPSDRFLSWIDATVLGVWFADQGHVSRHETSSGHTCHADLHTERFSEHDQQRLADRVGVLTGARPTVRGDGRGYWYLAFSKEGTEKLFATIREHVPPSMAWKVPGASLVAEPPGHVGTCVSRIRDVRPFRDTHYRHVYDVEVEEYHNYVAGNVIVSNCSMVDQHLLYRLLVCTKPTARLVFIGDDRQLPSVGPGDVLRDLIASRLFPTVSLTEIFRQSEASQIVVAAHAISRGEVPEIRDSGDFRLVRANTEEEVLDIVGKLATHLYEKRRNFQVMSPRHSGTVGVTNLNARLRELINPQSPGLQEMRLGSDVIREDDRIMVVKNNYDKEMFNGDVGKVQKLNRKDREAEVKLHGPPVQLIRIPFKDAAEHLRLAYCTTIHKMQGQEADVIVMPLVVGFTHQLQRTLIYTAITRARAKVLLVGQYEALVRAINNNRPNERNTLFLDRLRKVAGGSPDIETV